MSVKQNLNKELEAVLEKDEFLIWSDYPKQSFQLVFVDLIIIPFLTIILFIGFYLFINILNIKTSKELLFFSIFTIISSLILIYYRYLKKINVQKKSIYGLTSKRVIIIADNQINFLNLIDIKDISFIEHPFNFKYGTIIFG